MLTHSMWEWCFYLFISHILRSPQHILTSIFFAKLQWHSFASMTRLIIQRPVTSDRNCISNECLRHSRRKCVGNYSTWYVSALFVHEYNYIRNWTRSQWVQQPLIHITHTHTHTHWMLNRRIKTMPGVISFLVPSRMHTHSRITIHTLTSHMAHGTRTLA